MTWVWSDLTEGEKTFLLNDFDKKKWGDDMGGRGSGNFFRWDSKSTTEAQHRVDVRFMKKQGNLEPGTSGTLSWSCRGEQTGWIRFRTEKSYMVLIYRVRPRGGEWEDINLVVHFDRTPCNYGGYRTWFLCPRCRRRVAILYGAGGKYFLCRHCCDLTYSSQQENKIDRLMRKAHKIRGRLGVDAPLVDPIFSDSKPKGMHWDTFNRLRFEEERANRLSWSLAGEKFGVSSLF